MIENLMAVNLPTEFAEFSLQVFRYPKDDTLHFALTLGDLSQSDRILVRVHSQCFTGDTLGSLRCDCNWQLKEAQRRIGEAGSGILIYLSQEGRGIGLEAKLRAYQVQDQRQLDTVDANLYLGYPADARTYEAAVDILRFLGVRRISLLTNNPGKLEALRSAGFDVERCALEASPNKYNRLYLATKADRLGHLLSYLKWNSARDRADK